MYMSIGKEILVRCLEAMKREGRTGDIRIGYGYTLGWEGARQVPVIDMTEPLVVCVCDGQYTRVDRLVNHWFRVDSIHASTNGNFCPFEFASMKVE